MIWPLAVRFNQAQCPAGIDRGAAQVVKKQFPGDVVGAGESSKVAIVVEKLESPEVDLLVSTHCVIKSLLAAGERGRVENDQVKGCLLYTSPSPRD